MKINHTTNRIPGTGRSCSKGKNTVEVCLLLAVAYFGFSYGVGKVRTFQEGQLTDAELREIAERVVHVTESAEMAGVDLVVDGNVIQTIERVSQGGTANYGYFKGQYFGMPELKGKAKDQVANHLRLDYDRLSVKKFESFASAE